MTDSLAISLTAALGLSNGLFGSLPIILAPQMVREKKGGSELTGNLMTGAYCVGLTLGALLAYLCHAIIGARPHISCHHRYSLTLNGFPFSNLHFQLLFILHLNFLRKSNSASIE